MFDEKGVRISGIYGISTGYKPLEITPKGGKPVSGDPRSATAGHQTLHILQWKGDRSRD